MASATAFAAWASPTALTGRCAELTLQSRVSTDAAAILNAIHTRLPRRVRWLLKGAPFDFDFSADRFNLGRVTDDDMVGGPVPREWSRCRLIGRQNFTGGGGASPWIAICESNGAVYGLDIERDGEAKFIFNSSLEQFINTFSLFDQYLRGLRELPPDFASQVEALDPKTFPQSDWRLLIQSLTAE